MASLVSQSVVKYPLAKAGDMSLIPESGIPPGEGNGNHSIFMPQKSHGQRTQVDYSPWSHKGVRHNLETKITTRKLYLVIKQNYYFL